MNTWLREIWTTVGSNGAGVSATTEHLNDVVMDHLPHHHQHKAKRPYGCQAHLN